MNTSNITNLLQEQGFSFQFLFFVREILNGNQNDTIRYEEIDDISIISKEKVYVFQIKYHESKNLTTLSSDLWKTFYNWCNLTDKVNSFFLVTNSMVSEEVKSKILSFKNRDIKLSQFKDYLLELEEKTSDVNIIKYIRAIRSSTNIEVVFSNIVFEIVDDIVESLMFILKAKFIQEDKIIWLLEKILGYLILKKYEDTINTKKYEIVLKDFYKDLLPRFIDARENNFIEEFYELDKTMDYTKYIFINQAKDIKRINDEDDIIIYSTDYLNYKNNLEKIISNNFASKKDLENAVKSSVLDWKHIFSMNKSMLGDPLQFGQKVFDTTLEQEVKIGTITLSSQAQRGHYLMLSDKPIIGWLPDWKTRY